MLKKIVLLCSLTSILFGCAHGLIQSPPSLKSLGDYADIVVCRDSAFIGSAIGFTFTINGEEIYEFGNGDSYQFKLDPGEYLFGVKSSGGWQIAGNFNEIEVILKANKKYIYRLIPDMGSGSRIQPSSKCLN